MSEPRLQVEGLGVRYEIPAGGLLGTRKQDLVAVSDVSFTLRPGGTLGVVGETGCGKSTQVPKFLVEAGWAAPPRCVVSTQPRSVAARELASRVAGELGCDGVLMNTAIAEARDPVLMASAMKKGIEAGREAFLAGRMPRRRYASASSPMTDLPF